MNVEKPKFDPNNNKLTSKEYNLLKQLADNPTDMLKNIDTKQLINLKNSLENELKVYNKRIDVSKESKKRINSLGNKTLSNINKILSEKKKAEKKVNTETENNVAENTKETKNNTKNKVNILFEKVGMELSDKEKETLSTIYIENIDNFYDLMKEGKTELAKKKLKEILKKTLENREIKDTEYEKEKEGPIKIDLTEISSLESKKINLEKSLLTNLTNRLKNAQITYEEGGKEKNSSLADYLIKKFSGKTIAFKNGEITTNFNLDEKVQKVFNKIIRETLDREGINSKNVQVEFTIDKGLLGSNIKATDIDALTQNKNIDDIANLAEIDLSSREIDKNIIKVIYEFGNKYVKVKLPSNDSIILKTEDLQEFFKKQEDKFYKNLDKKHQDKIKILTKLTDKIKYNENKAILEEVGLDDLKIDGKIPDIEDKTDYIIINHSIKLFKNADGTFDIKDTKNLLPKLNAKNYKDIQNYYKILAKTKDIDRKIGRLENEIDELDRYSEAKVNLEQQKDKLEQIYKNLTNPPIHLKTVKDFTEYVNDIEKQEAEQKDLKEKIKKFDEFVNHFELNIFDTYGVSVQSDLPDDIKKWLNKFGSTDTISIHNASIEEKDNQISIKFDFNDTFTDEAFNTNIRLIMSKEKFKNFSKDDFKNYITTHVIPKIAKLANEGSKSQWEDEKNKAFYME